MTEEKFTKGIFNIIENQCNDPESYFEDEKNTDFDYEDSKIMEYTCITEKFRKTGRVNKKRIPQLYIFF